LAETKAILPEDLFPAEPAGANRPASQATTRGVKILYAAVSIPQFMVVFSPLNLSLPFLMI
jgi:hypothetical protein